MTMYAKKENQEQKQQASGQGARQNNVYGPRVGWDGKRITLSGTIVVYGSNSNIDVAANHFSEAIKSWNEPAFAPGTDRINQLPVVMMNGQQVYAHLDITVEKKTKAEVQRELQNPAPDRVYILAGEDSLSDYDDNVPLLNQRRSQFTPADGVYLNQVQTLPGAGNGGLARAAMAGFPPASFLIGNLGFYDVARSQSRGNTSAAHELGHWLSHQILSNGFWDSHVPLAQNVPFNGFWGRSRSIMSFGIESHLRTPSLQDWGNIGYGQDFNIYNNAAGPTGNYLGDRAPNGQLRLFNNQYYFDNPGQAAIFQAAFGNLPDWDPLNGVTPQ